MSELDEISNQTGYDGLILKDRLRLNPSGNLAALTSDFDYDTKSIEDIENIWSPDDSDNPFKEEKQSWRGHKESQSGKSNVGQNVTERATVQQEATSIAQREAINEVNAKLMNVEYIQDTVIPSFIDTKIEQNFDRREEQFVRLEQEEFIFNEEEISEIIEEHAENLFRRQLTSRQQLRENTAIPSLLKQEYGLKSDSLSEIQSFIQNVSEFHSQSLTVRKRWRLLESLTATTVGLMIILSIPFTYSALAQTFQIVVSSVVAATALVISLSLIAAGSIGITDVINDG